MSSSILTRWSKRRLHPTKAELAILRVLWIEGPLSVRDVQTILDRSKPTGYTTVLKTMQIMADKGLVDRDDTVRPQIYRARYSEDRTQKQLLTDLIQRVYGGSVKALVMHAVGTQKPSAEDLEKIKKAAGAIRGRQAMNLTADAISSALVHSLWQNAIVGRPAVRPASRIEAPDTECQIPGRLRRTGAHGDAPCRDGARAVTATGTGLSRSRRRLPPRSRQPATCDGAVEPLRGGHEGRWMAVEVARRAQAMDAAALAGWECSCARFVSSSASMHLGCVDDAVCARAGGPLSVTVVARLAARIGVHRSISVRIAPTAMAPATFGLFRPVILVSLAPRTRPCAAATRSRARPRARAHPPPRLSRQRAADDRGDAVLLPPGHLVGVATDSSRARAVLR